jgi:hypothetical protein
MVEGQTWSQGLDGMGPQGRAPCCAVLCCAVSGEWSDTGCSFASFAMHEES